MRDTSFLPLAITACLLTGVLAGCGEPELEPWQVRVRGGQKALHDKLYDRAVTHFGAALEEAAAAGSREGRLAALSGLAMGRAMRGDLAQAESLYVEVLALQRERMAADSLSGLVLARTLGSLAEISLRLGRVDRAETHLSEILQLGEAGLVDLLPEDRTMSYTLHGLSRVLRLRGDTARADSLAERALALQLYAFGFENAIGDDLGKAEQYYGESRGRFESLYGPDHEDVALAHHALGRLYEYQGRRDEAVTQYQRAVASYQGAGGPALALALVMEDLAAILDAGQADEAARLRRRASALRQGRPPGSAVN